MFEKASTYFEFTITYHNWLIAADRAGSDNFAFGSQLHLISHFHTYSVSMSTSGLKAIAPVPTANDFLDIVLSKTQRKTPTVCSDSTLLEFF